MAVPWAKGPGPRGWGAWRWALVVAAALAAVRLWGWGGRPADRVLATWASGAALTPPWWRQKEASLKASLKAWVRGVWPRSSHLSWPPVSGGVRLHPPPAPVPPMAYPVSGLLLLPYGGGLDPVTHRQVRLDGILLGAPAGSPVRSPCDAQVKAVRSGPPVGQEVVLQPLGRPQVQVHLVGVAGVKVRVGQRVRKGQTLGQVPAVGPRLVPHLFLEVTVHGVAVDPLSPLFLGPPA